MDQHLGAGIRVAAAAVLALGAVGLTAGTATADGAKTLFSFQDSRIDESSGLAASTQHPGVVWTHNDSGDKGRVYAVDERTGRTIATVTLAGISPRDTEAISMGKDAQGRPAVYLADIGDNLNGAWPEVWIYRFTEPTGTLHDTTVKVTRFTVRYSDGPRNAEALMVDPHTNRVYIASKEDKGGGLYAGPEQLSSSGTNTFQRIADVPAVVTDGAFSPDGSRLVLRGYFSATAYRWAHGAAKKIGQLDVPLQLQGEGVTFTPDGESLLYGSEGTGSSVWLEPLAGQDLPDSVQAATASRAASDPSGSSSAASHAPVAGSGKSSGLSVGRVLGFGILIVALLLSSRLFGRRRRGRRGGVSQ